MYRLLHYPPKIIYRLRLGRLIGGLVLLLVTQGRRTGLRRVVPLQYEWVDGEVFLASIRGAKADWYQNIVANSSVELIIGAKHLEGLAEPTTDIERITDFLELRLDRHPLMVGLILRAEGLSNTSDRAELAAYASRLALVRIDTDPR